MNLEFFKNEDFEKKVEKVISKTKKYLEEKDIEPLKFEEIIQWQDEKGRRIVYVNPKCPDNIKGIISDFIKEEF